MAYHSQLCLFNSLYNTHFVLPSFTICCMIFNELIFSSPHAPKPLYTKILLWRRKQKKNQRKNLKKNNSLPLHWKSMQSMSLNPHEFSNLFSCLKVFLQSTSILFRAIEIRWTFTPKSSNSWSELLESPFFPLEKRAEQKRTDDS